MRLNMRPNMPNMAKYAFLVHIWARQIWSSEVSLKRSLKGVKTAIIITINITTIIIMFPETKGKSWSNLRQAAPPIPPKMPPQLRNCSWRAPPWKMLYFSQRWIGNKSLSKIAIGQRSSILAEFQILIDITQTCGCSLNKSKLF